MTNKGLSFFKDFITYTKLNIGKIPECTQNIIGLEDEVVLTATLLQNLIHPQNKHRRESIEAGKYKEILTREDTNDFFKSLYEGLIKIEVSSEESAIVMRCNMKLYSEIGDMFVFMPTPKMTEEAINSFTVGSGTPNELITAFQYQKVNISYEKLKLVILNGYTTFRTISKRRKRQDGRSPLKELLRFMSDKSF